MHEFRKQEKFSPLALPRSIFYKTQLAGVSNEIFTSENVWKFLIKILLTKYDPERTREWKVPSLMPFRVKLEGMNGCK